MSINEAQGYRLHSNLTPKQQREAMENIYNVTSADQTALTYDERLKMRRLLDDLDRKEAGGLKEFDLCKPPVPPYQHREFPYMMYDHRSRLTKPARNQEERERMRAEGWSPDPFPAEMPAEMELTAAERLEAARMDRLLKMPPEEFEAMVAAAEAQPASPEKKRGNK